MDTVSFSDAPQLSSLGKISQTKVAKLKGIYKRLHGSLKRYAASSFVFHACVCVGVHVGIYI